MWYSSRVDDGCGICLSTDTATYAILAPRCRIWLTFPTPQSTERATAFHHPPATSHRHLSIKMTEIAAVSQYTKNKNLRKCFGGYKTEKSGHKKSCAFLSLSFIIMCWLHYTRQLDKVFAKVAMLERTTLYF